MKNITLFKLLEQVGARGWRGVLENTRRLVGLLNRVLLCVSGGPSKGYCIGIYLMSKRIMEIKRASGLLFTSMYLKQVSFHLQQYIGARRPLGHNQKIFVSLTRGGLPRFIPTIIRKRIARDRDPTAIRIVLSVCTLYKVIKILPRPKRSIDISSISTCGLHLTEQVVKVCIHIHENALKYFSRYVSGFTTIPMTLGYEFKPLLSSGPNSTITPGRNTYLAFLGLKGFDKLTAYHTLTFDGASLSRWWDEGEVESHGRLLFSSRVFYAGNPIEEDTHPLTWTFPFTFKDLLNMLRVSSDEIFKPFTRHPNNYAKFGLKLEGAGKVRTFVMLNPVVQTLLRPIHDWSMDVLSRLSTDGTYNQCKPLEGLIGKQELYSYDLKSATDLFPAELIQTLLSSLFGIPFAKVWLYIMTGAGVTMPNPRVPIWRSRMAFYLRGQPLGYYSSWSLFTMVHHLLVWMAADLIYPATLFKDYAILGDDMVIADRRVALKYAYILQSAGGVLSIEKSLISDCGCCEFAKRFIIDNHLKTRADVSPLSIPLMRLLDRYSAPAVFSKLEAKSLQSAFRLKGAGYKVYSCLQESSRYGKTIGTLSRKWRRLMVSLHSPGGITPLDWELWLTFPEFTVLDCYTRGAVYDYLLSKVKPPELDESSFRSARLLWSSASEELYELHLGSLVQMHLKYVIWHSTLSFDRSGSLARLLHPPVSPRGPKRKSDRDQIHRYGSIYQAWDLIRSERFKGMIPRAVSPGCDYHKETVNICLFRYASRSVSSN